MAITVFDKDCIIEYVPELNGNRALKKPVTVGIKPFMGIEARDLIWAITAAKEQFADDIEALGKELNRLDRERFIKHVAHIKNCPKNMPDGSRGEVTDPAELFDNHLALSAEIEHAMQNMTRLSEGQLKNFSGASVGSEKRTAKTGSPSTATSAAKKKK